MKKFLHILIWLPFVIHSQNSIRGKLYTSQVFSEHFPQVFASVEGFKEKKLLDKEGLFDLNIEKKQSEYIINFYINDSIVKTYNYQHTWTKRKRSKSISFLEECNVIKNSVRDDWKTNNMKLYVFRAELSKKDIRIQEKYNFKYTVIGKNDSKNFDCFRNYNRKALKYLVMGRELSLKKINKNTIGKNKFSLNDRTCIR